VEMESKIAVSQEDTDVPKDLECSICGDIFDKAVSLKACGHTYCSVCIRNHWVTTSRPGVHHQSKKECPLCRTSIGKDVIKALVVNRDIQQAVKAFKPASLPLSSSALSSSAKIGSYKNESPIKKRMQSRNYAGMQKNGKKELQRVCKEYNLPSSGNEQELVDRLRCFECMWNAELDTIDTPLRPSQLVVKFNKKGRMQREEKSHDIMTGKINDLKHMKKLTSSLLDVENKRNDRTLGATSSGNVIFDAKFKSNFAALIADGRRRMKKESNWSSPCKSVGLRTYDDDGIHDNPQRNTNGGVSCDNESSMETSAVAGTINFLERTPKDESTKTESSVGNGDQLSQKKKRHVYNPYKSERKRKFQDPSIHATTNTMQPFGALNRHTPNRSTALIATSASPGETTMHNPNKNKQLQQHQITPSPRSIASHDATRGNFDSGPLFVNSEHNMYKSQISAKKRPDRTPLARANNMNITNNIHSKKIDEIKIPGIRSIEIGISSNDVGITRTTPTQKKNVIHNPYKSSGRRNR
jgi:hypothetical protein